MVVAVLDVVEDDEVSDAVEEQEAEHRDDNAL